MPYFGGGVIEVLDTSTGVTDKLPWRDKRNAGVGFTRDGRLVAASDSEIVVFEGSDPKVVWTGPPGLLQLAVDPEGRWVVFLHIEGTGSGSTLRVVGIDGSNERALVTGVPTGLERLTLSPDGGRVAISDRSTRLVIDVATGDRVRLGDRPGRETSSDGAEEWSPDGNWVMFRNDEADPPRTIFAADGGQRYGHRLYDLRFAGADRVVGRTEPGEIKVVGLDGRPRSPTLGRGGTLGPVVGTSVLVVWWRDREFTACAVPLDGTPAQPLLSGTGTTGVSLGSPSPDGRAVLVTYY
jgi:hypothetical protein